MQTHKRSQTPQPVHLWGRTRGASVVRSSVLEKKIGRVDGEFQIGYYSPGKASWSRCREFPESSCANVSEAKQNIEGYLERNRIQRMHLRLEA